MYICMYSYIYIKRNIYIYKCICMYIETEEDDGGAVRSGEDKTVRVEDHFHGGDQSRCLQAVLRDLAYPLAGSIAK